MFGISHDRLLDLKYQIGLGGKETDIENFWLLLLLDLGVIGFTAFLAVFAAFLLHIARYSRDLNGWLLVISALIINSGSNSLGVKSVDLFMEVAFLVAISGYAGYRRPVPMRFGSDQHRLFLHRRPVGSLGAIVAPVRGLRLLRSKLS